MKDKQARRSVLFTLGFIILVIVLFVVFVDLGQVVDQLARTDWRYAIAAGAVLLVGMVSYAVRWRLLLGNVPGRLPTFHAANAGHTFNILIPLRAGMWARVFVINQLSRVTITEGLSSVMVERLLEQVMRLTALGGAIVLGAGLEVTPTTAIGTIAVVIVIFAILFLIVDRREYVLARWPAYIARLPRLTEERVHKILSDWLNNLAVIASPGRFALAFLLSLVTWSIWWGFHLLVLLALNTGLPTGDILAMSLGSLALAPPSAPTQPGLYQASIVAPLAVAGFNENLLTAYAVLLQIFELVLMIGLGLWGLNTSGASLGAILNMRGKQE